MANFNLLLLASVLAVSAARPEPLAKLLAKRGKTAVSLEIGQRTTTDDATVRDSPGPDETLPGNHFEEIKDVNEPLHKTEEEILQIQPSSESLAHSSEVSKNCGFPEGADQNSAVVEPTGREPTAIVDATTPINTLCAEKEQKLPIEEEAKPIAESLPERKATTTFRQKLFIFNLDDLIDSLYDVLMDH